MSTKPVAVYYNILKYQAENLQRLNDVFELIQLDTPEADTPEILQRVEVLFAPLGYMVDKGKIDRCPRLRVIASNTTGHPHIDVTYAREKGVEVACLKFAQDFLRTITPTAELAWCLILALTRNVMPARQSVLDGRWDRRPFGAPAMLSSMQLGIVGLGRLGTLVARYGRAFGMQVCFFDPYVERWPEETVRIETLEELVARSDVISIHVPHEPETEHLFDSRIFRLCKMGAWLVNTARAEIVDPEALLQALESGRLSGAAMDVFPGEYKRTFADEFDGHPLLTYARNNDNLLLTPHIGGSTVDAWRRTEAHAIDMALEMLDRTNRRGG